MPYQFLYKIKGFLFGPIGNQVLSLAGFAIVRISNFHADFMFLTDIDGGFGKNLRHIERQELLFLKDSLKIELKDQCDV